MGEDDIKRAVEGALQPFNKRIDKLDEKVEQVLRQRTLLLAVAILCLVTAAFAVGYGINRGEALKDQVGTNNEVVCAQVRSTALAYRKPLPNEARDDFLQRMIAQRQTLLLVGPLDCPSVKGFATFAYLRGRALHEIEGILRRIAPPAVKRSLGISHHVRRAPPASVVVAGAPNETAVAVPPVDGGGTEEPGPSGGNGDSTGGPGPPQHPPQGGGGGGSEGGGGSAPAPSPEPAPEPAPVEEQPASTPPPPASSGQQSVLSPALDSTCNLPAVSKLLCTPR